MFENNAKKFFFSFIIVIIIFAFDRFSKFYILNLAESEKYVDIYFNSFLNFSNDAIQVMDSQELAAVFGIARIIGMSIPIAF